MDTSKNEMVVVALPMKQYIIVMVLVTVLDCIITLIYFVVNSYV